MAKRKDCYTDEEKDEIIAYVLVQVASGRFVSRVFREDATTDNGIKLPARWTFWKWIFAADNWEELSDKLTHAREQGVEALIDEAVDIADQAEHDTIVQHTDNGSFEKPNNEWMARSRLRVETRLKLASLLKPRKYGAKLDVTSGGEKIDSAALAAANERAKKYDQSEEARSHGSEDD